MQVDSFLSNPFTLNSQTEKEGRESTQYPMTSNALCTRKPALGMPLGKKIHNRHPKPLQVWLYFPAGWQNVFATCKTANTTPKFYCLSGEDEECLVFFKDIFLECLGCVIMSIPIFFILYKKKRHIWPFVTKQPICI